MLMSYPDSEEELIFIHLSCWNSHIPKSQLVWSKLSTFVAQGLGFGRGVCVHFCSFWFRFGVVESQGFISTQMPSAPKWESGVSSGCAGCTCAGLTVLAHGAGPKHEN